MAQNCPTYRGSPFIETPFIEVPLYLCFSNPKTRYNSNIFFDNLEFLICFNFLCKFHAVESESEVRIYLKARFHCQFLHLTPLSDDFLVQLQTINAKMFHLRTTRSFCVAMYAVTIPQVFTEGLWLNI